MCVRTAHLSARATLSTCFQKFDLHFIQMFSQFRPPRSGSHSTARWVSSQTSFSRTSTAPQSPENRNTYLHKIKIIKEYYPNMPSHMEQGLAADSGIDGSDGSSSPPPPYDEIMEREGYQYFINDEEVSENDHWPKRYWSHFRSKPCFRKPMIIFPQINSSVLFGV